MPSHAAKPTNTRDTSAGSKHAATGQRSRDVNQAVAAAAPVAQSYGSKRQAAGTKPSTTGRTVKGAAGGAATGAALGSVVPGIGTAVGAGVGAAVGGAGGAVSGHKAKKQWKADKRAMRTPATRALIAEFVICIIILALSPLTGKEPTAKDWMKKGTAMCGLFMALGMTSSVGPRTGRAMAAFGFLVTLALLVNQRSVFVKIAEKFGEQNPSDPSTPPGPVLST